MMHNLSLLDFCEPQQHPDDASQLHPESSLSLHHPQTLGASLCLLKRRGVLYIRALAIIKGT